MENTTKKIFIITGDYSGDKHASNVVKELLKINSDIIIEAIGGENLKNTGIKLFSDHSKMNKVGFNFKIIKEHLTLGKRVLDYLKNEFKPDLILLVDYGAFNLAISKPLKKAGFKIFYFIPPQVWASRKWRVKTIKKNIDKVLTIFPFEKEIYENAGVNSEFVGHPLVKELPPKADKKEFFMRHNLNLDKRLVSVFPGSRGFEIKYLLDIFIESVEKIKKEAPDVQFVFSHAPNLPDNIFKDKLKDYTVIKGENQALLSISDSLILASGTVSLEAGLYKTPMLIAYRGPILFYLIYLLVREIKQACLINIMSKKEIVKEFLMFNAESGKIANETLKLLNDKGYRENQIKNLDMVQHLLKEKHCVVEVAQILNREIQNG